MKFKNYTIERLEERINELSKDVQKLQEEQEVEIARAAEKVAKSDKYLQAYKRSLDEKRYQRLKRFSDLLEEFVLEEECKKK